MNPVVPRVGIGTDIHAFAAAGSGRELWLAGLLWEGEVGLEGHSDADVVAHAACNALFSAAGLGDLGQHFGTGRPQWAGASGVTLLTEACRIVREAGFQIGNVAVQVVGTRPKVGRRRAEVQAEHQVARSQGHPRPGRDVPAGTSSGRPAGQASMTIGMIIGLRRSRPDTQRPTTRRITCWS